MPQHDHRQPDHDHDRHLPTPARGPPRVSPDLRSVPAYVRPHPRHDEPPPPPHRFDLRALLRNPSHNPELKHRTGLDQEVFHHVMTTPGAERLAFNAVVTARSLAEDTGADVTIAWGCTGGRHRVVDRTTEEHAEQGASPVRQISAWGRR
ncbi:RNase adapter RapZ [Streptomyces sp. HB132]|uniref:RapZ C-terminal domain-containing protein n=1 Tax=Streptomyces sp. HB132 TaxID=767388 RepID=UPI0027DCD303|nr:RNase adapter RapZ [Streptomyces sp. HB132]